MADIQIINSHQFSLKAETLDSKFLIRMLVKFITKNMKHGILLVNRYIYVNIQHRSDSMWGTDYIANPFFFLLGISRTTIKNLRWQLSGEITQVTFGKFVTLLVQQLKKKFVHKNCATGYCLPLSSNSNFFLRFWTNDDTNFLKVTWVISTLSCHLRFLIVVLETF